MNAIVACCLGSKGDPTHRGRNVYRSTYWDTWAMCISDLGLQGVCIHDGLPEKEQLVDFGNRVTPPFLPKGITMRQVPKLTSPYEVLDDCWPLFLEWLLETKDCQNVFFTDICDVKTRVDPFTLIVDDSLYVCREEILNRDHLYTQMQSKQFYGEPCILPDEYTYNSGIVGGRRSVMIPFLRSFIAEIERVGGGEQTAMNMVIHRDKVPTVYGKPLHSQFGKRMADGAFSHK